MCPYSDTSCAQKCYGGTREFSFAVARCGYTDKQIGFKDGDFGVSLGGFMKCKRDITCWSTAEM